MEKKNSGRNKRCSSTAAGLKSLNVQNEGKLSLRRAAALSSSPPPSPFSETSPLRDIVSPITIASNADDAPTLAKKRGEGGETICRAGREKIGSRRPTPQVTRGVPKSKKSSGYLSSASMMRYGTRGTPCRPPPRSSSFVRSLVTPVPRRFASSSSSRSTDSERRFIRSAEKKRKGEGIDLFLCLRFHSRDWVSSSSPSFPLWWRKKEQEEEEEEEEK